MKEAPLDSTEANRLPVSVGWRGGVVTQHALSELEACLRRFREPVFVRKPGATPVDGEHYGLPGYAYSPALHPEDLGDPAFRAHHGVRFAYYTGSMANGIGSEAIVEAMGNAGMLGFFGAAGLAPARIEVALQRLTASMAGKPWGCNLINSPGDPIWQEAVADLYIKHGVPCIEASAYISLSLPLVKYRTAGIHVDADGSIVVPNHVIAKLSRVEVARRFLSPPPEKMLRQLVEAGHLTPEQAALAAKVPVADDVTVEADSGGHTDHRPAITVLPAMLALRDEIQAEQGYPIAPRIGLGGGIGTPSAVAATFQMGAAYVVTGSINQACAESGSSDRVRAMLANATQTDVGQAPAADMFEMGVKVQVLRRGTMFAQRALKLYELYQAWPSIEAMPAEVRAGLDKTLGRKADEIWAETVSFWTARDPHEVAKAERDPKHKMALIFRWYLGLSSRWAIAGEPSRKLDYQIWCGPAMGAFNAWTAGTFLAEPKERRVVQVALNLLEGAACVTRAHQLRSFGAPVPPEAFAFAPRRLVAG